MLKRNLLKGKIEAKRIALGYSPEYMANKLGRSQGRWYAWMKHPEILTVEQLEKIERILDIKLLEGNI